MFSYSQEQIFLFFFIIGLILGILFDFFRSLRRCFKTSDNITFVEDFIFLIISITLISIGILKLNNGIIRFYLFIGIFFGILIYSLTISNLCVIIFTVIIRLFKYILKLFTKSLKHFKYLLK